jgi:hypothetical protein
MMAMNDPRMTDMELDQLLAQARSPALPQGFADRLQAKLERAANSNVVAFPQARAKPAHARRYWLSAVPLAASLAIGIYLGAAGSLPESLAGLDSSLVSDASDAPGIGIEDTESFLNGDLS